MPLPEYELRLRWQLDLVKRGYDLCKQNKLGVIWVECGKVYVSLTEKPDWKEKQLLSWEGFEQLIVQAESELATGKKGMALVSGFEMESQAWRETA